MRENYKVFFGIFATYYFSPVTYAMNSHVGLGNDEINPPSLNVVPFLMKHRNIVN